MRRLICLLAGAAMVLGWAVPASSAPNRPPVIGPIEMTGVLLGAPYEIRVPAGWNGTLVVYAHGYRDRADHPGEVDDRSAQAFFSNASEEQLLEAGYAIAGSAFRENGWAVAEGIVDTNRLVEHFRAEVGRPDTTIVVGFSMGSVIAFEAIERFPDIYDGAIPSCPVGAGVPRAFDGTLAISAVYSAVFGWPATWGTPGDVRDDLDFETEVLPRMVAQLTAPGGAARWEFIQRTVGVPDGPEWPFSGFFFLSEGRAELERRAGGPVVQNLDHRYRLSTGDRAALVAMGLTPAQIDQWLAAANATDFAAPSQSRHYVKRNAEYTGRLRHPVLTFHTVVDALVPPAHIDAYNRTVAAQGRQGLLVNTWTSGVGHCNFTAQQALTVVDAMNDWIETGVRPTASSFPASQGFVADFTPPPWPQP